MTTATQTKGVEFNCLGGSVELRHGYLQTESGEPKKMYFSRSDVEKMKLDPEKFLAKRNNGMEIGLIKLDMNRKRKLIVPYSEKTMIELLKSNDLVSEQGKGQRLTNKVSWFDPEQNKLDRQVKVKTKQVALLVCAALSKESLRDLSICLGINEVDTISDPDFANLIDNKPERIMDLLDAVSEGGIPKGKLKETTKVEAVLRRAINSRVVTERSGALHFADEQIGTDFKNSIKNLMNKNKGDELALSHVLPLIKAKLDEQ